MGTVRRTVTMPAQLAAAIDAAVADGAADSVSALLATAARRYLDQLTDDRITTHAARLDPNTELAVIRAARNGAAPAGWERLT
jgi:Arc/MetJ-type ribon-helix-helix transcriptional regulator